MAKIKDKTEYLQRRPDLHREEKHNIILLQVKEKVEEKEELVLDLENKSQLHQVLEGEGVGAAPGVLGNVGGGGGSGGAAPGVLASHQVVKNKRQKILKLIKVAQSENMTCNV